VASSELPAFTSSSAPAAGRSGLRFYEDLRVWTDFTRLGDEDVYQPLRQGWTIGVADIERSTDAVAAGRYKEVNTVAAAVIAAVSNALSGRDFPFVFGGDGAGFALPEEYAATARTAMAAVAGWALEAFGFRLRIASVPIASIRKAGRDVRLARFAPSPDVSYAMFHGGGLAWAEARMKAGDFRIAPAEGMAARPDLSGLSCRFSPISARHGLILSLVALPAEGAAPEDFAALVHDVLELAGDAEEIGNPVPPQGPPLLWPPAGMGIEARAGAVARARPLWLSRTQVALHSLLAHLVFKSGLRVGRFDPKRYRAQIVRNTDFRKFDDGLRMTLDCTPQLANRIEQRVRAAEAAGVAAAGLHRQDAALMTCFVPSTSRSDHVHFVDGAMGGYAAAAAMALRRDPLASAEC